MNICVIINTWTTRVAHLFLFNQLQLRGFNHEKSEEGNSFLETPRDHFYGTVGC